MDKCKWEKCQDMYGDDWYRSECSDEWHAELSEYCPDCGRKIEIEEECKWVYDQNHKHGSVWHTLCGKQNYACVFDVKDEDFIYCPHCGRKIEIEDE